MARTIQIRAEDGVAAGLEAGAEMGRPVWCGSLSLGLIRVPVRAVPITRDRGVHFRMLHSTCNTPIHYDRRCELDEEVPFAEVAYGLPVEGRYVVFDRKEVEEARPESSETVDLDSFINLYDVDPHYLDKTYLLLPDGSGESYALLRRALDNTGKAAIGRVTLRSRERVVLVHHYRNALVMTTMRYHDEVLDPGRHPALLELPEPGEKDLRLAEEIVNKMTGKLDIEAYSDAFRQRIEEMARAALRGTAPSPVQRRQRIGAESLGEALEKTAQSLR